jgi:isopentenyl diphosphate isomerase/L-lactate dehydrogenase-like FMN-dependent dehydrogenase
MTMQMCGARNIAELDRRLIRRRALVTASASA